MFLSLSSTISTVLICAASLAYRKCNGKGGALAEGAVEPHLAAVQLDEAACKGKAEAGALGLARVIAPDLLEFLENRGMVLRRDADAGVLHRDFYLAVESLRRDVDLAAVGRELDRIRQQVDHDLLELALVGAESAEALVHLQRKPDAVALRALAYQCHRVRQRAWQVEAGDLQ